MSDPDKIFEEILERLIKPHERQRLGDLGRVVRELRLMGVFCTTISESESVDGFQLHIHNGKYWVEIHITFEFMSDPQCADYLARKLTEEHEWATEQRKINDQSTQIICD